MGSLFSKHRRTATEKEKGKKTKSEEPVSNGYGTAGNSAVDDHQLPIGSTVLPGTVGLPF